jgi:hypothetical protein
VHEGAHRQRAEKHHRAVHAGARRPYCTRVGRHTTTPCSSNGT